MHRFPPVRYSAHDLVRLGWCQAAVYARATAGSVREAKQGAHDIRAGTAKLVDREHGTVKLHRHRTGTAAPHR